MRTKRKANEITSSPPQNVLACQQGLLCTQACATALVVRHVMRMMQYFDDHQYAIGWSVSIAPVFCNELCAGEYVVLVYYRSHRHTHTHTSQSVYTDRARVHFNAGNLYNNIIVYDLCELPRARLSAARSKS